MKLVKNLMMLIVFSLLFIGCDDDSSSSSSQVVKCESYATYGNIDVVCECNEAPAGWLEHNTPNCFYQDTNKVCATGSTFINGSCVTGNIPAVDARNGTVLNTTRFSFDGTTALGSSVWRRDGLSGYISNAMNISFWGDVTFSCPTTLHGPTIGSFTWVTPKEVYIPYPTAVRSPLCPETGETGSSYVAIQDGVGVGVSSYAGADPRLPYDGVLQTYPVGTPGRSGLLATYVTFNPSWILRPWTSATETVAVVSEQFVPETEVDNNKTQVQQNMRVAFINDYCMAHRQPGQSCQFSWNTKLYIEGINTSDNSAHVMFDPAQGGLAVILGWTETSPYWDNKGVPTQRVPYYGSKTFHMEMSWTQAQNLIIDFTKAAFTAQGIKKDTVTSAEVAVHFGAAWQNKAEWTIHGIGIGQEVYNPDKTSTSYINGMLKSLDVIAK